MHNQTLKPSIVSPRYSPSFSWVGNLESPHSFFATKAHLSSPPLISPKSFGEELKMPLILFPKNQDSGNHNRWGSIAADILRTINAEFSFAKKSELFIKRKQQKDHKPADQEKISTEEGNIQKSKNESPERFFSFLKIRKDQNIPALIKIDTLAHLVPRSDTMTRFKFPEKKQKRSKASQRSIIQIGL